MRKSLLFCGFLLFVFFISCKKPAQPDNTKYTVKGRVVNATTNTFYVGPVYLEVQTDWHTYPNDYEDATLVSGNTDAAGNFSLTYTHTSITGYGAQIYLRSNFFSFGGIAVNQNDSQNFYNSTEGTLKVFLHTTKPLETNHDTLFLGLNPNNNTQGYEIDTVLKTINGLYKTMRVPIAPNQNIYWGRGWDNFHYDKTTGRFLNLDNYLFKNITGDPYVDSVTVNY